MKNKISTSKKKVTRQPTLIEYLAGAGIANVPMFILAFLFSYIDAEITPFQRSSIILTLIFTGTMLAGFLVARRVSESYARAGAITGAISFLVYCAFIFLTFQSVAWNIWIIFVFVLGGYTGGRLWELEKKLPITKKKLREGNTKSLHESEETNEPSVG